MITNINDFKKSLKINENIGTPKAFDPYTDLSGDDRKVFDAVETMCGEFDKTPEISGMFDSNRIEPIITEIIDQTARGHEFPYDKRYYVFVNNYSGKGYVEIECGIDPNGGELNPVNPAQSSHGYPASYGESVYSYDRKTGAISYDSKFFRFVLG